MYKLFQNKGKKMWKELEWMEQKEPQRRQRVFGHWGFRVKCLEGWLIDLMLIRSITTNYFQQMYNIYISYNLSVNYELNIFFDIILLVNKFVRFATVFWLYEHRIPIFSVEYNKVEFRENKFQTYCFVEMFGVRCLLISNNVRGICLPARGSTYVLVYATVCILWKS